MQAEVTYEMSLETDEADVCYGRGRLHSVRSEVLTRLECVDDESLCLLVGMHHGRTLKTVTETSLAHLTEGPQLEKAAALLTRPRLATCFDGRTAEPEPEATRPPSAPPPFPHALRPRRGDGSRDGDEGEGEDKDESEGAAAATGWLEDAELIASDPLGGADSPIDSPAAAPSAKRRAARRAATAEIAPFSWMSPPRHLAFHSVGDAATIRAINLEEGLGWTAGICHTIAESRRVPLLLLNAAERL